MIYKNIKENNYWMVLILLGLFLFYIYSAIKMIRGNTGNPDWCYNLTPCNSFLKYKRNKTNFYGGLSPCHYCSKKSSWMFRRGE